MYRHIDYPETVHEGSVSRFVIAQNIAVTALPDEKMVAADAIALEHEITGWLPAEPRLLKSKPDDSAPLCAFQKDKFKHIGASIIQHGENMHRRKSEHNGRAHDVQREPTPHQSLQQ